MPNSPVDRWIQRLTLAAMVALTAALLSVGVSLYAGGAQALPRGTGAAVTK